MFDFDFDFDFVPADDADVDLEAGDYVARVANGELLGVEDAGRSVCEQRIYA